MEQDTCIFPFMGVICSGCSSSVSETEFVTLSVKGQCQWDLGVGSSGSRTPQSSRTHLK